MKIPLNRRAFLLGGITAAASVAALKSCATRTRSSRDEVSVLFLSAPPPVLSRFQISRIVVESEMLRSRLKRIGDGYLQADGQYFTFVYKDPKDSNRLKVDFYELSALDGRNVLLEEHLVGVDALAFNSSDLNKAIILFDLNKGALSEGMDLRKLQEDPKRDIAVCDLRSGKPALLKEFKLGQGGKFPRFEAATRSAGSHLIPISELKDLLHGNLQV